MACENRRLNGTWSAVPVNQKRKCKGCFVSVTQILITFLVNHRVRRIMQGVLKGFMTRTEACCTAFNRKYEKIQIILLTWNGIITLLFTVSAPECVHQNSCCKKSSPQSWVLLSPFFFSCSRFDIKHEKFLDFLMPEIDFLVFLPFSNFSMCDNQTQGPQKLCHTLDS